jgi:hypothetical protein
LNLTNISQEYYNIIHIKKLTKTNITEFYKCFILFSLFLRSKLVVYLKAQKITNIEISKLESDLVITKLQDGRTRLYIIEDINRFKSIIIFSERLQSIKDIKEYKDLDKKIRKA